MTRKHITHLKFRDWSVRYKAAWLCGMAFSVMFVVLALWSLVMGALVIWQHLPREQRPGFFYVVAMLAFLCAWWGLRED